MIVDLEKLQCVLSLSCIERFAWRYAQTSHTLKWNYTAKELDLQCWI